MSTRLDHPTQRLLALVVFCTVFAIKISRLAISFFPKYASPYAENLNVGFTELGLYCLLDLAFFCGLYLLKIPRLRISFCQMISYCLISYFFNYFLFRQMQVASNLEIIQQIEKQRRQQHIIGLPAAQVGKVPSQSSIPVLLDSDADLSSHILGSHRVQVLPKARCRLNPTKIPFCVIPDHKQEVNLPIEILKGVPPFFFDFEFTDLNGKTAIRKNQTVSATLQSTAAAVNSKHLAHYTTSDPGIYKVLEFRDSSGDGNEPGTIVSSASTILISRCPSSTWIKKEDGTNKCVEESHEFAISVKGVAPLSVWYARRIQGTNVEERIEQVFEEDVETEQLKHISCSKNIEVKLDSPGTVMFKILNVTDGLNNAVVYSDAKMPDHLTKKINLVRSTHPGDTFTLHVNQRPTANFADCEYKVLLLNNPNETMIPVEFRGTPPFTASVAVFESQDDIQSGKFKSAVKYKIEQSRMNVPVTKEGIYVLTEIHDKYCAGNALGKYCNIPLVMPPTIEVSAKPIEKACVGAVGAVVNISMTGEPPFEVDYDEIAMTADGTESSRSRKRVNIEKSRHFISFQPERAGFYKYQFQRISDKNYKEGVSIPKIEFTQIVHSQPIARLQSAKPLVRCVGDSAEASVLLSGRAPWQLSYEVLFSGKKIVNTIVVENSPAKINIGPLDVAGNYTLSLTDVASVGECPGTFKEPSELKIEVRSQRPTASFTCKKPISFLEGSFAELGVNVNGIAPFKVVYGRDGETGGRTQTITLDRQSNIRVASPGSFRILSVEDAHCSGIVVSPATCQAVTIPKPTVQVDAQPISQNNYQLASVCESQPQSFHLRVTGTTPFTLSYTHKLVETSEQTGKQTETETIHEEKFNQKVHRITADTTKPGTHVYQLNSVMDANYKTKERAVLLNDDVHLTVLSKPGAYFASGSKTITQCLGSTPTPSSKGTDDGSIIINFTGMSGGSKPPYQLQAELKHENYEVKPMTIPNISTSVFHFVPPTLSNTGKYFLQLLQVVDGNGCTRQIERDAGFSSTEIGNKKSGKKEEKEEERTSIEVIVSDIPRITPHSPKTVCVGDLLSYSLQGTAPFKIDYVFGPEGKGEVKTVEVADPLVQFYAGAAGELVIKRVVNLLGCEVSVGDGMRTVVRELPKAIVDGGEDMAEDIREGLICLVVI
ncbi:hypothetical protein HK098_000935 [Nowakowskiella sp. JEL0407]|nr:hypothetical protein HK098_000935 [Nowakowskiella sp. JEL0407]